MRLAKTTLVRWFSLVGVTAVVSAAPPVTRPAPSALAALVRPYREQPSPARRAAVEGYATAHAGDADGSLARLALGVIDYEQKNYPAAIAELKPLMTKLPQISDYVSYYLGAARVESEDFAGVGADLASSHRVDTPSPVSGRAWLLEARALQHTDAAQSVRVLRDHYSELPEPAGDVTLADSYLAAGDMTRAADFYQRVYYEYVSGDAAARAAAALEMLKSTLGASYPPPLPRQMLRRADRLMDAREYRDAHREYQELVGQLGGTERDIARVRAGAADFLSGSSNAACSYLSGLDVPESEADAERLYYLAECARKTSDDSERMSIVKRLEQTYRQSPWRLKALVSAANGYLLQNRPDDFVPLYRTAYQDFPLDPLAPTAHWKVTFQAYLAGQKEADELLREHLRQYPGHATAGAALYFLARLAESQNDTASARTYYVRLDAAFPNTYYGMLARGRLEVPELHTPQSAPQAEQFLATLSLPETKPVSVKALNTTTVRIDRARLLRNAGLNDLAESELRFGARNGGQPVLLGMEIATNADASYQGLRVMKSLSGDYLDLAISGAPRKFWELLFPLPYRADLVASARAQGLDPYLLAGLIRQESEFNPDAVSRKNALGLTQVQPGTGRRYARQAGVTRFNNRVLFHPATNLRIGAKIFQAMLDQHGGSLEQTLAAYNAGPNKAAQWIMWRTYREPAEFVESIPFTETRDYVQAVLRNADVYRRLYQ
jgi:soluble lytic murein transglycosylase